MAITPALQAGIPSSNLGTSTKKKEMGVMSCSRNSCESIMCGTYVDSVGYVCNECQSEFKEYLISKRIVVTTEGEINRALKKFMETEKDEFAKGEEISVDDFFKSYTKDW